MDDKKNWNNVEEADVRVGGEVMIRGGVERIRSRARERRDMMGMSFSRGRVSRDVFGVSLK